MNEKFYTEDKGSMTPPQGMSLNTHVPYSSSGNAEQKMYSHDKSGMIMETYRYLLIAIAGTMASGYLFGNPELESARSFLSLYIGAGGLGYALMFGGLLAMPWLAGLAINTLPKSLAPLVLGVYGFVGGMALAPLIFITIVQTGDASIVNQAVVMTGCAFAGATFFAWRYPDSLGWTKITLGPLACLLLPAIGVNIFLGSGFLGTLISYGVAALGMGQLLHGTRAIRHDPRLKSPADGAFILYAGLFNLFQAILSIMSRR